MDSHQSILSPFKNLSVVSEPDLQKTDDVNRISGTFPVEIQGQKREAMADFIGVLEVYIHQARDIQNICIYHKQDVYAKLCLTSDPETTVSTKLINGGGKNPVFNENLQLNVRSIDSSLKCEIWMLSRVRNYMEDQLLGFSLVPLSDVLVERGKLEQEFSLSSNDLFHSPSGFVQLSLSYSGSLPEVLKISTPRSLMAANTVSQDSEIPNSLTSDFDTIEFPDPKIVNENQMMVSEYFGIQCSSFDSQSSESLDSSETDNHHSSEINPINQNADTPLSSVSTSVPVNSQSICDSSGDSKSPNLDQTSSLKEIKTDVPEENDTFAQSVLKVNIEPEPEQTMVQQDIVDMYMKSMQQFTESLAKMKLPMDLETGPPTNLGNGDASSDKNLPAAKGTGSRVFYGSRAFF